jgi:hypothetical protein
MADDVSGPYRYSLSDLPMEPPDTFGSSYPSGQPNRMGVAPFGAPPGLPAGFGMRLPGRLPPGPFPMPGQPVTPIPMPQIPEWWKTLGKVLQALPIIVTGTYGAGGRYDDPDCKEEWADAMKECAKELAKLYPDKYKTGGHTTIEDCARGKVTERCGGNPTGGDDAPYIKPRRRR